MIQIDPGGAEGRLQRLARLHRAVRVEDAQEGQVQGAGHVAGAQPRARLGGPASEPVGGAGVQHLFTGIKGGSDGVDAGDQIRLR